MTTTKLLTAQKIISTKHFQSQFASVVKEAKKKGNYYNVVRNSESVGVFLPTEIWEALLEDIEAMSSKNYLANISESRKQIEKDELYDLDDAFEV